MIAENDDLLVLAETLGEVKTRTEKLEAEFSTQARPLESATSALSAALAGIKALQFHVIDNNLGALSARVEEMRKAVDEQVGVIALELKRADETNATKAGQDAEALRAEIAGLQAQLGTLGAQFTAQLARVEFAAKEEAKKLQLIPGPAGEAGASLNPRGTFIDGETYNRLDVVSWLGSSYIATVDGVTEKPSKTSNQWQVLASRGNGGGGTASLNDMLGAPSAGTIVGSEGTAYVRKTLVAGANIAITETPSTITITGSEGEISLEDGSAAAPSLFFTNDPDTGIYRPGSNQVGISLGGSAQAVLTSTTFTVTPNLVVSGTGTSSFGGNATVGGTLGVGPSSTLGTLNITTPNLTYGTVYLSGATTGADFMRLKSSGADGVFGIESSVGNTILTGSSANATVLYSVGSNPLQFGTAGTVKGTLTSGGNLLIGTTTDSANGKLQLADHTTSAGGIGFGTDISLYRVNPNSFKIGLSAANFTLDAGGSGTGGARIVGGGGLTLTSNTGESLYLQSGGLVGITINSSQQVHVNATTASTSTSTGALTVGGGVGVAGAIYAGGKLNLSTHTTNAGGIAFGTDWNLYRKDQYTLVLEGNAGGSALTLNEGATAAGGIGTSSGNLYVDAFGAAKSIIFRTNAATTALTLNSSQNATFAGTLTVSAGSLVVDHVGSSSPTLSLSANGSVQSRFFANGSNTFLESYTSTPLILRTNQTTALTITTGQQVQVNATTASTTTSSGALVVSGGVGVAGAINVGGNATVFGTAGITINNVNGLGNDSILTLSQSGVSNAFIKNTATTGDIAIGDGGGTYLRITKGVGVVSLLNTTASTSTATGALVVSGGVGVAGAVNVGGSIVSNPLHTVARKIEAQIAHSVSTEDYVRVSSNSGTTNTYGGEFGYGLTAGGSPQIKFNRVHAGTVTTWLTVPTSSGDAEFAGSLKTAAPSGGTAANWKLGTVATVSPTSPNRTIEVDIGGTIYYIHAKTTNN